MPALTETLTFEALSDWQQLPGDMHLHETPGVAVDAGDRVFALTRNVSKLSTQIAFLGTKRETPRVRERVRESRDDVSTS